MGKAKYIGPVPPDDPMFSSGPEIFSRRASSKSSSLPPATSLPLSGSDPVMEHLKARGLPLTRPNWILFAGLTEPLDGETEGYLLSLPLEQEYPVSKPYPKMEEGLTLNGPLDQEPPPYLLTTSPCDDGSNIPPTS